MTKAVPGKTAQLQKTAGRRAARRVRKCPQCPLYSSSGQCLDPRLRSGRCGDRIMYVVRGKQFWRLDVKARDPRTPKQRACRARLAAASSDYSARLTDAQQDACIAAGAKRRSQPRLGQAGRLTGQQWWVQERCRRQAQLSTPEAQTPSKSLQTKDKSTPSSGPHRTYTVFPPYQYRGSKPRASRGARTAKTRGPKPETRPNWQRSNPLNARKLRPAVLRRSGYAVDAAPETCPARPCRKLGPLLRRAACPKAPRRLTRSQRSCGGRSHYRKRSGCRA
jgi:hypothetical protein